MNLFCDAAKIEGHRTKYNSGLCAARLDMMLTSLLEAEGYWAEHCIGVSTTVRMSSRRHHKTGCISTNAQEAVRMSSCLRSIHRETSRS